jgi:hypothetical protein
MDHFEVCNQHLTLATPKNTDTIAATLDPSLHQEAVHGLTEYWYLH